MLYLTKLKYFNKLNNRVLSDNLFKQSKCCFSSDNGPLSVLKRKYESNELKHDDHQLKIAQELQRIYEQVHTYQPPDIIPTSSNENVLTKWLPFMSQPKFKLDPSKRLQGLYIYGSVGGGKTMLMDMFFDCCENITHKTRAHFNSFMTDVHKEIHRIKQQQYRETGAKSNVLRPFDPITPVAQIIKNKAWLICFDEFQVTDIADAMILKRLFTKLFDYGVVVIATSNRQPDDLYKGGLQRSNFVPFIPILKNHCQVAQLDSGIDYRSTNKGVGEHYFVDAVKIKLENDDDSEADCKIDTIFKVLCSQENDIIRPKTITHFGRNITFEKTCGQILDTTFDEICCRDFGASDYVQLAQYFHTIIIRYIPQLNYKRKNQARRFITLIDSLYDNRVRVVISAEVPLQYLFSDEKPSDIYLQDENRALMDDLALSSGSADLSANVFTGEEELFAFERTKSRLREMQTAEYWQLWEKWK
ncbi:putative ATPase N2B isoform X1 [Chironomus tepperi]|uniref:putative ATPase N2B isoform X1 n=1 Tax=Chironomus tepperi TaxID=113505 RepID=UPI00391F6A22